MLASLNGVDYTPKRSRGDLAQRQRLEIDPIASPQRDTPQMATSG